MRPTRSSSRRAVALAALGLLAACAPGPVAVRPSSMPTPPPPPVTAAPPPPAPTETPDAEFRKNAPEPGPPVTFVPPTIGEARLSNGIRVLMVERHEMPIVALQVVALRGASEGRPGVGAFAGSLMMSGTKQHSALELSDAFEALGANHWSSVDYDGGYVGVQVLSSKLPQALSLVTEVVQSPSFPKEELQLERARRITAIQQERDNPNSLLWRVLPRSLYPARHPYASTLLGDEAAVEKITTVDLATFHRAQFQPDRLAVVAAGDFVRADLLAALEGSLGKLKGKAEKARELTVPPPPAADAPRIILVDRPGASQSNVAVSLVGVPRATPDYDALQVMNAILGGQFSSRLNLNLREQHGYTYGANSGFRMRQGAGPFAASGAIVTEHTADAIQEIFREIEQIQKQPVSDAELADAKSYLIRALPALFESASGTSSTLTTIAVYGLPLDEFSRRPERLERVSREDVQRVASQRLTTAQMRIVIVGDAEKIRPSLEALKLGKIDVQKIAGSKPAADKPAAGKPASKPSTRPPSDQPPSKPPAPGQAPKK